MMVYHIVHALQQPSDGSTTVTLHVQCAHQLGDVYLELQVYQIGY